LVVEGAVKRKDEIVKKLCNIADYVIAVGSCAVYGNILVLKNKDVSGLQFRFKEKGGILGEGFIAGKGYPVINLSGCPANPEWITGTLLKIKRKERLNLDELGRPREYYDSLAHWGCSRNEFFEWKVEAKSLGKEKECLLGGIYICLKPSYKKGKGKRCKFNLEEVKELNPPDYTKARPVRYKGLPYETSPLARQLLYENPFVKKLYSLYEDSYLTRVSARVLEIWELLSLIEKLLEKLIEHLDEKSFEGDINKQASGQGVSFIEAARGTLIHKVVVEKGKIMKYEIITPSQWNLGPRCNKYLGVAKKAIIGLDSELKAEMVLRSFDLCSVCTTH